MPLFSYHLSASSPPVTLDSAKGFHLKLSNRRDNNYEFVKFTNYHYQPSDEINFIKIQMIHITVRFYSN